MISSIRNTSLFLLALALSACASALGPRTNDINVISVSPGEKLVIEVQNKNLSNATVFLNGRMLGLVNGPNGHQLFVLNQGDVASNRIQLKAHIIGGEDFNARPVTFISGRKVTLILNKMLASSDVFEQ